MALTKINAKDLLFSGDIEDDRTNTYLTLNDYDWMDYHLDTRFKTELLGILDVKFEYFGMTMSRMEVKQKLKDKTIEYIYEYPTDVFQKHITLYLRDHIASWTSQYAFNGEDQVLRFFNEIIESGTLIEEKEAPCSD